MEHLKGADEEVLSGEHQGKDTVQEGHGGGMEVFG
jgi:hypothetical protein